MKSSKATAGPLLITISPGNVYISTNPDQSSYANLRVTIHNGGTTALSVNSISVTLPPALAPENGLNSITPIAGQPKLWSFGISDFNAGEFDATSQTNSPVTMKAGDTWTFTLQMVTLVNATGQSSADVAVGVIFGDGTSSSTALNVNILPAVASIISFNSTPSNINPGQSAELNWQCEKINYCIINPISSHHYAESGTLEVTPETTTIYTLYAYGDSVILSAQWAISVENAQIVLFGGSSGRSSVNYGDSITLVWECNQYTESLNLIDDSGVSIPVNLYQNGNTPQKGTITVGPLYQPTTFTFTAYGNNSQNFDQRTPTINIRDLVCTMSADRADGTWAGDDVTITWNIEGASSVSISPAITNGPSLQKLSGSAVVNPMADVTYVLTASGFVNNLPVLNKTFPLALTIAPIVINSFALSPAVINPVLGSDVGTLLWDVQGEVVSINNGVGSQPVSGSSYSLINPPNGTVYTLTAGSIKSPNQQTQSLTVANTYGPYTVNALQINPLGGVNFMIPDPGSMALLTQGLFSEYYYFFTLTGIEPLGGASQQYMANANYNQDNPSQLFFLVQSYTDGSQPVFQWTDPANPTGTITLTWVALGPDMVPESPKI